MKLVKASELKPKYWYLQQYRSQAPFWDSFLHARCDLIRTQPYNQNPFKIESDRFYISNKNSPYNDGA